MQTSLTDNSPEFEQLMDQLPMACRIFELGPDDSLIFVKANPTADQMFRIRHTPLEGLPIEKAFPNFSDSVVPERYREILETGKTWSYHGVFYQDNGNFIGLFNVNAFRLTPSRMASFSSPQEDEDAEIIIHKTKMNMRGVTVSYPETCHATDNSFRLGGIPKIGLPQIPLLRQKASERINTHDIKFTDLFTIDELEKIQAAFTNVTNVASIITMPDGRPITRSSNFCTLCDKIIRKTPKGLANCIQSDSVLGKPNPSGPTLRPCLSVGIWDCGASIIIGEKHVANWLVGQVRISHRVNRDELIKYAGEIGADPEAFLEAYHEVPVISFPQFNRICRSLFLFANLISDMAYQNLCLVQAHNTQEQILKALRASESRLQNLSSKLILTQEEERKQLAIELHDGIGQSLTAVKYSIDNILLNLDNPRMDIKEATRNAGQIIKGSIADVRRMQVELRPRILDELGIIATINWFCREFRSIYRNISLDVNVGVIEERVSDPLKPAIFRIIQEAFNNAAKYCEGDLITLSFQENDGELILEIRDNGIGFDLKEVLFPRELNRGLGLDSMRERAELCGGHLDILTTPGKGTVIRATWKVV